MTTPKPPRRWFQYNLRTLLVLMLTTAILCGLLRSAWEQARREKIASEELRKLGASTDDWPGWRELVFGRDYAPIVQVELRNVQQLDAALEHLAQVTSLEHLSLDGTQTTDQHPESLPRLAAIQSLDLQGTLISDAGLEHLSRLSRLRHLWLANTKVTDQGVEKLQQALPSCKIIR